MRTTLNDMNEDDIWRWQQHQHKGEDLPSSGGSIFPLPMSIHPSRRTDTDRRVGRGRAGSNARFHGKRFMEVDDESSMIFQQPPSKKTRISRQSSHSSSASSSSACDASGGGGTITCHRRSNLQRPLPVMRDWSGLSILSYNDERNIRSSVVGMEHDKDNDDDDEPYTVGLPQLKPLDEKMRTKSVHSTKNDTTRANSLMISSCDQTANAPPPPPPPPTRRASSQQKKKAASAAASPPQQASTTVHSRVTIDKTETNARRRSSLRRVSVDSVPITPDDDDEVCLGEDFVPGDWDVVCGRGKNWSEYVSNRRFRVLVAIYLNEYFETISRTRKSIVINTIVTTIQNAGGEGFVKKKGSLWFRITSKEAREKTSHCLRDCLVDPQSEQNQWSLEKRKEKLQDAQNNVLRSLELIR